MSLFLDRKIHYLEIPEIIEYCMEAHKKTEAPTVEEILLAEAQTYEQIESRWS